MKFYYLLVASGLLISLQSIAGTLSSVKAANVEKPDNEKPNIIFIMADDLGYGDIGCYGQKIIKTPHLDQMAAQGIRFTDFYSGSTVCAPSRCVLMTGLHTGHCRVRGNKSGPAQALTPKSVVVSKTLSQGGYKTALIGKWGLGQPDDAIEGLPNKQGFDYFFGYLNQGHAHNYYPEILWRNTEKIQLCNVVTKIKQGAWGASGYATKRIDYSHDMFMNEALNFIDQNHKTPFFLYLPFTIPHANNEGTRFTGDGQDVPDYGIYTYKKWSNPDKGQAAMITRMDYGIGALFALLKKLKVDENTIVFFTSDNGPHLEGGNSGLEFFNANGPLRGMKRDLYEGGVRVPLIVRWPGKIKPGTVTKQTSYFGDFFATATEIAGIPTPKNLDSISFVPTLLGQNQKNQHSHFYWEFYERGSKQAVRKGKWKAVRMPMFTGKVELYDLENDLGEESDVASAFPNVVKEMAKLMDESHTPSELWKVPPPRRKKKQ